MFYHYSITPFHRVLRAMEGLTRETSEVTGIHCFTEGGMGMAGTYDTGKSRALYEEGCEYITGGVASTLHKSANEDYPLYIERGEGSKIYDVDGNEYIDTWLSASALILDHKHLGTSDIILFLLYCSFHKPII